jgi:hypothetical protein
MANLQKIAALRRQFVRSIRFFTGCFVDDRTGDPCCPHALELCDPLDYTQFALDDQINSWPQRDLATFAERLLALLPDSPPDELKASARGDAM